MLIKNRCEMKLKFEQKKPGRIKQSIQPIIIEIDGTPVTVGELIKEVVIACVKAFNERAMKASSMDDDIIHDKPDQNSIDILAETGRVTFGLVYNEKTESVEKAVANAIQCYEDGIYRMFLNGKPLGEKESIIELTEGDCLTIVRLTMLAGRLW